MRQKKLLVIDNKKHYFPLKEYFEDEAEVIYSCCPKESIKKCIEDKIINESGFHAIVLDLDDLPLDGAYSPSNIILKAHNLDAKTKIIIKSYKHNYMKKVKEEVRDYLVNCSVECHSKFDGIVPLVDKLYNYLNI